MKRILVLPDDWATWVSLEGDKEDPKPDVWWVTDEAYERLQRSSTVTPVSVIDDLSNCRRSKCCRVRQA